VLQKYGDPGVLAKYQTIFVDSITVAGRLCFQWCKGQPQAFSEKTGKPDLRGAYGLHGQEMIGWITHLQHTRNKNVWFVGILDEKTDDFNRRFYAAQIEGAKTGLELPGIVDQVISMVEMKPEEGPSYRAFVCQTLNPWSYPAKDRSGRLAMIEEPHLGRLMEKIRQPARPVAERLNFERPDHSAGLPNGTAAGSPAGVSAMDGANQKVTETAPATGAPATTQTRRCAGTSAPPPPTSTADSSLTSPPGPRPRAFPTKACRLAPSSATPPARATLPRLRSCGPWRR
jgi:hypothetical protein